MWLNIHSLHILLHKHVFAAAHIHLELYIFCRTAH